jgi:hypothetical protein
MFFSTFVTIASIAVSALAAPQFRPPPAGIGRPFPGRFTCDISAKMTLPANQTTLTAPTAPVTSVVLGVGFQNYTCSDAGTYVSAGAVADLYDISCLSKVPAFFNTVQDQAFSVWKALPASVKTLGPTANSYPLMGSHFFVTSPSGTGLSPVWDTRAASGKGKPDAFVLAAKIGNIPAPTGKQDVDWLQLKNVQGGLAAQVYRTDTRGGPAPASCTPGSAPISVKYVSKYWLFGGTVKL